MENASMQAMPEELEGKITFKFEPGHNLIELCERTFNGFHADNHEPIAIRLYHGRESFLTLYALDKVRQETSSTNADKLPVRKFKKQLTSFADLLPLIAEFNFTLRVGNFPLDDMEVVNK